MLFGQYIKEQRLSLGISSRKLSEKVGKSSSYISSIEKGLYKPDDIMALKILKELRIEIPNGSIPGFLHNHGIEVRPYFGTSLSSPSVIYAIENSTKKKVKPSNYQNHKLYKERQEEVIELLNNVIEQIEDDISNYPSEYGDCENDSIFESTDKFLTTFTGIMLDSEIEIYNKFYELMNLPLQKLNPVQFQNIIDYVSNIIEYEYVFESGEKSKTQKYPHHRVKYKNKNN